MIVNVDENRKETADALAGFVPNLIVTHPLAPLDNLVLYRQLGSVFGKEHEAERLCDRFEAEYEEIRRRKFQPRNILYLIWKDPWMTVSRDTYVSRTLALFGLQTLPAVSDARYPELEDLNVGGTELVLLSTEPYRFRERHREALQRQLGLPVRLIDAEMTSWYGSRAIAGLGYLAEFSSRLASAPAAS